MRLSEKKFEEIKSFFEDKHEIAAVYVYGSQVKGSAHEDSDIDLAVLAADKNDFEGFDLPQTRYTNDLENLTGSKIEVQDMRSVSIDFAHRIISEGVLLTGLDSKKRIEFEENVLRVYFDMKPFLDEYYKSIHEIAKRGELNVRYY